jgi:tetraprenyl-beta-curcumene synthase
VFPHARRELAFWRRRAAAIPDPELRRLALATHAAKGAHSEGAAAFATLAPPRSRRRVVRALVALQAMYDYLDTVSEQPGVDPFAAGRRLHRALVVAVDPRAAPVDYYAHGPGGGDGGYIGEMVAAFRSACAALPSYRAVTPAIRLAAIRAMESQGLHHALGRGSPLPSDDAAERWAARQLPPGAGFRSWEVVGAAGSSLAMLALVATAAAPELSPEEARAIETLYFPWAGALLGLADSLADAPEDAAERNHSIVGRYRSPGEAAGRMALIGERSLALARLAPQGRLHMTIVVAMVAFFLSAPGAALPEARAVRDAGLASMGELAAPAMAVLRARRLMSAR